jgi:hypothetical protein
LEIKAKVYLDRAFQFSDRDTIEGVITFRIDNRLSRGGNHGLTRGRSATRSIYLSICILI